MPIPGTEQSVLHKTRNLNERDIATANELDTIVTRGRSVLTRDDRISPNCELFEGGLGI